MLKILLKEQTDVTIDPDETPITETAAERAEREARYSDDDDYTPDNDNSIGSR